MHSEHHEGTRGQAAAQSGEAGCDKVFPAQFFAAVFHPDVGGTPVAPGGRGIEVLARRRSGSEDDAADLAAVAAGRVAALEAIYDRHGDALYRLALRVADRRKAAEDAAAGVFGALWQGSSNVDLGEQSLRGALAGAVYSRCIEGQTRRNLRKRASGLSALAALPCMQRDLLALVLLGEHTRGQAAARVGVSHDAAAGMLTQALRTVGGLDPSIGDGIATVAAASRAPFGLFARPRAVGALHRGYESSSS